MQRIALSATLGNPDDLLAWLTTTCRLPGHVLRPAAETARAPEVSLDYVGTLENAALVISRLHRGEKRLVFVDSRARAEKLGAALRAHEVTTFVSHGSLGAGERHLAAQQLLALALQDSGTGRYTWTRWLGDPFVLGPRTEAEAAFGRKHFLELLSVFTSPPVLSVRHGRDEIGLVPDEALLARPPGAAAGGAAVLTLAGRSWLVLHIDWRRRTVQVEPTSAPGVARWTGGGQPLGAHVARGIRSVLCGADPVGVEVSARARERLAQARTDHSWAQADTTTIVGSSTGKTQWWTFAGWRADLWLAAVAAAAGLRDAVNQLDDLAISLDPGPSAGALRAALREADPADLVLAPWITAAAIDGLKFAECLPLERAVELVALRLADPHSVATVRSEQLGSANLR